METFGRYQLISVAGSGGMAHVHLARQVGPDGFIKPCVLKRISPDLVNDRTLRRMFMEEARVSALLNHPNVVQTFDYGEVDGVPYMAMELVDGVNLAQLCRTLAQKRRWLPLQPIVEICIRLASALEYAHALTDLDGKPLNLVHRDVSPQNTLLSRAGAVKLADFGIARHDAREQHTLRHTAKGKPGYMAPEQAMGGAIDARADLFSVGVVLTELLSARRVLPEGGRVLGVLEIEKRIDSLCALRKDAPPELAKLARDLAALEPDARPRDATETLRRLRLVAGTVPASKPLDAFLRDVFEAYVEKRDLSAPPPPVADEAFEKTWLNEQPAATGTSVVYEGWPKQFLDSKKHPPALALPEFSLDLGLAETPAAEAPPRSQAPKPPPSIELVERSSSVDAMQYFGAETSSEAQHRNADVPVVSGQPVSGGHPGAVPLQTPGLDRALGGLSQETATQKAEGPPGGQRVRQIPAIVYLAAAAVVVVVIAVAIIAVVGGRTADPDVAPVLEYGTLEVKSSPAGATIFINGRKTKFVTPHTADRLPLDSPIEVRVEKGDHAVTPGHVVVRIPPSRKHTSASFTLIEGRRFHITSTPPDAVVTLNGQRISTPTPVTVGPVALGTTASITVELDDYLPSFVAVPSRVNTSSIVTVTLEAARRIDVVSEPPGATVLVDGEPAGTTPAYDVLVPETRRFTILVQKRGFKRWRKRLRARQVKDGPLMAELRHMPLLSMPLERNERKKARTIDREVTVLRSKLKRLSRELDAAQKKMATVEASNTVFVGDVAQAQRRVDVLGDAVSEHEIKLADAEARLEMFRERVLQRIGEN